MIYFVQAVGGQGPIKIGYTWGGAMRMDALQRASPVPLVMLAAITGDIGDERALHERFQACRLYGEWFQPTEDLLAVVAGARAITTPRWLDYQHRQGPPRTGNWNPRARYRKKSKGTRLPNYFAEKAS